MGSKKQEASNEVKKKKKKDIPVVAKQEEKKDAPVVKKEEKVLEKKPEPLKAPEKEAAPTIAAKKEGSTEGKKSSEISKPEFKKDAAPVAEKKETDPSETNNEDQYVKNPGAEKGADDYPYLVISNGKNGEEAIGFHLQNKGYEDRNAKIRLAASIFGECHYAYCFFEKAPQNLKQLHSERGKKWLAGGAYKGEKLASQKYGLGEEPWAQLFTFIRVAGDGVVLYVPNRSREYRIKLLKMAHKRWGEITYQYISPIVPQPSKLSSEKKIFEGKNGKNSQWWKDVHHYPE